MLYCSILFLRSLQTARCVNNLLNFLHLPTGPEYGTSEAAWQGLFTEADRASTLHSGIRDQLANDVYSKVKLWQKDTYTKQKLGGLKQHKEMDDGFTKVGML